MDEDEQVTVSEQLNMNISLDDSSTLWEDDFTASTNNLSLSENELQNHHDSNLMQRCFEFVKKHAKDVDPEFILSLLQSEIDNPRGLELVMCEMLNIPNALELVREFRRSPVKAGDKRSPADSNPHPDEAKKKKKDTDTYLQQMKDMFPDADGLFLITECQQLETSEDFSRFVNTVMLSGVYPKKGAVEYTSNVQPQGTVDVINVSDHSSSSSSSEEEVSSSGLTETNNGSKKKKKHVKHVVIDLTDPSSSDTVTYEPPQVHEQDAAAWEALKKEIGIVELTSNEFQKITEKIRENNYRIVQKHFPEMQNIIPMPGTSGEGPRRRNTKSLPPKPVQTFQEILAEITEERDHKRRSSNPVLRTTDPLGLRPLPRREGPVEISPEVSDGEVPTSSQGGRYETDGGSEEGEVSEERLGEQTANLIRIFPNTDPSFLREEVVRLKGCTEAINAFVVAKLERNDMPSRAEYEKKLEMEELQNRYTKNFSIEDFVKAVPDPWAYFTGNRNCAKYKSHSLCYLKSTFRKRYIRDIIETFNRNNCNLYLSYQELKKDGKKTRTSQRSIFECNHNRPTTIDIQFLQEVAFIENEDKIKAYLEDAKLARQMKFDEAKRNGSLVECQCCFDSEVMVEDIFYCPKDHPFCRSCIIRSVEVEIGYGRHNFVCLSNCEEKFTLACLQNVLSPDLFSKVIKAIQMEEIRAAGIEDLVQCPFCTYATIMPPEQKVLACLNPECLKESCRLCKELNHIPLRCDEVEKSEEVKLRTYIENKMTEALVRTCYKCGKKFVKEDGCNKMTCTCGARMCYVCRKPVTDYSHFNGQGGTEFHKCPLYSTNDELHVELVKRVGEEAKAEILQANPNAKLVHDPTAVEPERTHQRPMPGVNNGAALDVAMRAIRGTLDDVEAQAPARNRDHRDVRREATPRAARNRHRAPETDDEEEQQHNHVHYLNIHQWHRHNRRRHQHHNHHLPL